MFCLFCGCDYSYRYAWVDNYTVTFCVTSKQHFVVEVFIVLPVVLELIFSSIYCQTLFLTKHVIGFGQFILYYLSVLAHVHDFENMFMKM